MPRIIIKSGALVKYFIDLILFNSDSKADLSYAADSSP